MAPRIVATSNAIDISNRIPRRVQSALDLARAEDAGGVGVDSGHGYHVVSPTGQRHEVKDKETLEALGTGVGAQVPWEILRLLPEGSALNREQALQVSS